MKRILPLTLSLLLGFACTRTTDATIGIADNPTDNAAAKIISVSDDAVRGELLVKFDEQATATLETSVSRSAGTRSGIDDFDAVLECIGARRIVRLFAVNPRFESDARAAGLHRWYKIEFADDADLDCTALEMARVAEVSCVEFNRQMRNDNSGTVKTIEPRALDNTPTAIFNDPRLAEQWHYINTGDKSIYEGIKAGADIDCGEAWRLCTGDPAVIVAVVDNCVDWTHPDLAANMWTNTKEIPDNGIDDDGNGFVDDVHGYNFVTDSQLAISTQEHPEHGTHVAGTVAAVNNNGIGVCGIAGGSGEGDGVRIMSCQAVYNSIYLTVESAAKAIQYAADNGASIIQCSYSRGQLPSDADFTKNYGAERTAIDYFIKYGGSVERGGCGVVDGGIAVFAAGNSKGSKANYPSAYRECISVTSITCDFLPASYTNYGPGSNIAAPGGDTDQAETAGVLSTVNGGGYAFMEGTSMACPHVSGVAALAMSYAKKLGKTFTRGEFHRILLTATNDIYQYLPANSQYMGKMGTGLIDAYKALLNVEGTPCVPVAIGSKQLVSLADIIGGGTKMTILGVTISDEDKARLGIEGTPSVTTAGKLVITCTKRGSARMTVRFVGGGSTIGSESNVGGMEVSKECVIVAHYFAGNNGWL